MSENCNKKPLIGRDLPQLRQIVAGLGLPGYAATQIAQWLYEKRVTDIEQMTNLSKQARKRLAEEYCVGLMPPLMKAESTENICSKAADAATSRPCTYPTASEPPCA